MWNVCHRVGDKNETIIILWINSKVANNRGGEYVTCYIAVNDSLVPFGLPLFLKCDNKRIIVLHNESLLNMPIAFYFVRWQQEQ